MMRVEKIKEGGNYLKAKFVRENKITELQITDARTIAFVEFVGVFNGRYFVFPEIDFFGLVFEKVVDFRVARFCEKVSFNQCTFKRTADFGSAKFEAEAGFNVDYAYVTVASRSGNALCVFKVLDPHQAEETLSNA